MHPRGVEADADDKRTEIAGAFQMHPRGVEAGRVVLRGGPAAFQMHPRGVEARATNCHSRVPTSSRCTLVGLKRGRVRGPVGVDSPVPDAPSWG